jgi:cbb3-type cytochrome oxidase maturation protein
MDILYMLVPLSVVLVLAIVGVLAWSVRNGQFDDVEQEGERILEDDDSPDNRPPHSALDLDQGGRPGAQQNRR